MFLVRADRELHKVKRRQQAIRQTWVDRYEKRRIATVNRAVQRARYAMYESKK